MQDKIFGSFVLKVMSTEAEYQGVLDLRLRAYLEARKVAIYTNATDMADEYDAPSTIHVAKKASLVIGSVRVTVPKEGYPLFIGRDIPNAVEVLPDVKDFTEGSRMCTHPDFRQLGLFYPLAASMIYTATNTGRRYLVGSCTYDLIPLWEKCGFFATGIRFSSSDVTKQNLELLLLDTLQWIDGRSVSDNMKGAWERIASDCQVHLVV
jgi:N-acyl-L-homoserine lactone synthetase